MARSIATGYGEQVFTDSQTWSATVATTGETTLGNISVPENEQWNIYAISCSGYGGEYRLDCTGNAASANMFEFGGIGTVGSTIKLVSQDETVKTYICVAESGSALDGVIADGKVQFEAGASTATHAAVHFKAAVEHADGHNGKITVTLSGAEITMAQNTVGKEGNTVIDADNEFELNLDAGIADQFTGGTDGLSALVGKFIQNDVLKAGGDDLLREVYNAPYATDIVISGPCVLTMYVSNAGATSTTTKGMIQYTRLITKTAYDRYDENGVIYDSE